MLFNFTRLIFRNDYEYIIPLSGVLGAMFFLISNNIARTVIFTDGIPIGIIISLIDAPFLNFI